jgi:hypothetical protein
METIQDIRSGAMGWREGTAVALLAKTAIESVKLNVTLTQLASSIETTAPAIRYETNGRRHSEKPAILPAPPAEKPDTAPVVDDALRVRIYDHLSRIGPQKPALIASDLEITSDAVKVATNHEWFLRTLDGIAVAKSSDSYHSRKVEMSADRAIKGTPVFYDDDGRPVSPRWAPAPEEPTAEKQVDTGLVTLRIRKWLADYKEGFVELAECLGCEADVMLLLMVGFVSQDTQIIADAMEWSPRWVRPRVNRLRKMGMWSGGVTLGSRFGIWNKALTGEFSVTNENEVGIEILLDIMEIDGIIESRCDTSGEPMFRLRQPNSKAVTSGPE